MNLSHRGISPREKNSSLSVKELKQFCEILIGSWKARAFPLTSLPPYLSVLCAFLCPLFKCNDIGQKIYSKIKSCLLKLDFGIREYINQKKRERSGR